MSDYIAPQEVLTPGELAECRDQHIPPPRPMDNPIEEPTDAAVRLGLGLRSHIFDLGEQVIDPRPCPAWCIYGSTEGIHEVDPHRPFDAFHSLGTGARVALSRYRADRQWGPDEANRWIEAATIVVDAWQNGQDPPYISLYLRLWPGQLKKAPSVDLSVADAKDLITALTYVVDVLEGRRPIIEGSE